MCFIIGSRGDPGFVSFLSCLLVCWLAGLGCGIGEGVLFSLAGNCLFDSGGHCRSSSDRARDKTNGQEKEIIAQVLQYIQFSSITAGWLVVVL